MIKSIYHSFFNKFRDANFEVCYWDGDTIAYGQGEPVAKIVFKKPLAVNFETDNIVLAFGEAYMDGVVDFEGSMEEIINIVEKNKENITDGITGKIVSLIGSIIGNSKARQKQNIQHHYDLGNDFFSLWLDETMSYSCAYFKKENDSLKDAQYQKVHHILDKLHLQEGMTLLDIGCGWGFLLIEAALTYGVKGYGCTLSEEQWKKGQERIKQFGLEGQVEIDLIDYRDVAASGRQFDRMVSVGMLEHVGRPNLPIYMEDASAMLKEGGLFLLHYISDPAEKETSAWIRKYIFPGGSLPSLREIIGLAYEYDMNVLDVENLRFHYYKTLMHWYNNFQGVRDQVEKVRGTEFVRMWDLYLCGCAAGFYIGNMDLHQILMTKCINNELPLTRWY